MTRHAHWSTWYSGTEREWQAIPIKERDALSFKATGCTIAYPTWKAPVECVHGPCRVRRGEMKPIRLVNGTLRYERESGWLRFVEDRAKLARIYRAVRKVARGNGSYDAWSAWGAIVYGGVL